MEEAKALLAKLQSALSDSADDARECCVCLESQTEQGLRILKNCKVSKIFFAALLYRSS